MERQLLIRPAFVFLLLAGEPALAQESGGALGDPLPPPVQDPSLKTSVHIPVKVVQGGVADTGHSLSSAATGAGAACSAANPCAVPTPALNHSVPARADQ